MDRYRASQRSKRCRVRSCGISSFGRKTWIIRPFGWNTLAVCSIFTNKSCVINGIAQLKIGKRCHHQQVGTFQENPQMCYFEMIPSLKRNVNKSWLVVSNMNGLYGMSSQHIPTPLTNSIIFQRGGWANHQAVGDGRPGSTSLLQAPEKSTAAELVRHWWSIDWGWWFGICFRYAAAHDGPDGLAEFWGFCSSKFNSFWLTASPCTEDGPRFGCLAAFKRCSMATGSQIRHRLVFWFSFLVRIVSQQWTDHGGPTRSQMISAKVAKVIIGSHEWIRMLRLLWKSPLFSGHWCGSKQKGPRKMTEGWLHQVQDYRHLSFDVSCEEHWHTYWCFAGNDPQ